MTMTVDAALREAASAQTYDELREFGAEWTRCDEHEAAHRVLAAEVERLRADNTRLNKENDDWHKASVQLREEAQTARLALDVALKQVELLKSARTPRPPRENDCPSCGEQMWREDPPDGPWACPTCRWSESISTKPGAAT